MPEPVRRDASVQVRWRPTGPQRALLLRMLRGGTVLEGRELLTVLALQRRGWAEPGRQVVFRWQEHWILTDAGERIALNLRATGRIDGKRRRRPRS